MDKADRLKELQKEREHQVTRIFWLGLEIAFWYAIPLAIGIIIGKKIGGNADWYSLPIAFVISTTGFIFRYRRVARKMEGLDREIRELKQEIGQAEAGNE